MPSETIFELRKLIKEVSSKNILSNTSDESRKRMAYKPPLCTVFRENSFLTTKVTKRYQFEIDINSKKQLYNIANKNVLRLLEGKKTKKNLARKRKVGILFSGGPSPGGHNVVAGLFDALKKSNPNSSLFGFIMGADGIIEGNYIELTNKLINKYRNQGSFSMIGTSRTKIDTIKKIDMSKKNCKKLNLDAIVIVGGDDSNTNAAFLAQEMFNDNISVIGVPKSIDGDIQVKDLNGESLCLTSFGFHTASQSFSHFVSNLCVDAKSDLKYWHICKVMGRSASHIALEVAIQTHANLTLIGEELVEYTNKKELKKINIKNKINFNVHGMTLKQLIKLISNTIVKRAKIGKNFGVIVIPEGILEFINEIQVLIIKLNHIIADYNLSNNKTFHETFNNLNNKLEYLEKIIRVQNITSKYPIWNKKDSELFKSMPILMQKGLLTQRDSHGNFQFSQVKTEEIIMDLLKKRLKQLQKEGKYSIGIDRDYYTKVMRSEGINENIYGPVIFRNWKIKKRKLLFKYEINSRMKLVEILIKNNLSIDKYGILEPIYMIFEKSIPNFKAQTHFYGYDGRGENPSNFDCIYAYNLGQTAFHLLNNNATGQMASILNICNNLEEWEPIGISLALLMNLEERKGNLSLVLKKSMVDLESPAFKIFKIFRTNWLSFKSNIEHYRLVAPLKFSEKEHIKPPITMVINQIMRGKIHPL